MIYCLPIEKITLYGIGMKKLFILATFLSSLVMSSVVNAEWTKVGGMDGGTTHYVDFDRTKKFNGKVYYSSK